MRSDQLSYPAIAKATAKINIYFSSAKYFAKKYSLRKAAAISSSL